MTDNTDAVERNIQHNPGELTDKVAARIDEALAALLTPEELERYGRGRVTLVGGGPNNEAGRLRKIFVNTEIINVDIDEMMIPLARVRAAQYGIKYMVSPYQDLYDKQKGIAKLPSDLTIMLSPSVSDPEQAVVWKDVTEAALANLNPGGALLVFTQHRHEFDNMKKILELLGNEDVEVDERQIAPLRGLKNERYTLTVKKKE